MREDRTSLRRGVHRVFLLSPANSGGERMALVLSPRATFPLARAVQAGGAPLGEVFRFASGLYFRGKLAYAEAFARPPRGIPGALVIVPGFGLVPPAAAVGPDDLRAFAAVPVNAREPRFRAGLEVDHFQVDRRPPLPFVALRSERQAARAAGRHQLLDALAHAPGDRAGQTVVLAEHHARVPAGRAHP